MLTRPRTIAVAVGVTLALSVAVVAVTTMTDPTPTRTATHTSRPSSTPMADPSSAPTLTSARPQQIPPPADPNPELVLEPTTAATPTTAAASPTATATPLPSTVDGGSGHSEPDPTVVTGTGPDTAIEQLAVDRLLADATGIGRDLWPDLDGTPCCPDAALSIGGVTTLTANDTDEVTVVIAWTADTTSRVTTSTWTPTTANNWIPT